MDTDNLKALTTASSEPALYHAERNNAIAGKAAGLRMKGAVGLAASALLATSLLLSACGDEQDDCIPSTPPTGASNAAGSSGFFGTPGPADPSQPNSSQFTTGQPTPTNQVYCKSRRTGGFYWYTGSRFYSGSSSSGSSSS